MSTYTDASLIYYPSGVKAGKAYSLKPTDGSGDLTFTRASTATRVNESGLIEEVATGVPRIDFTGGGCGKLLLEPQRTNLVFPSQDFNAWGKTGISVTNNSTTSPDGTINASKIIPPSGTSGGSYVSKAVAGNSMYVFAKQAEKSKILIYSGVSDSNVWFDISSGQVLTQKSNVVSASVENYGDGWYKCSVIWTTISSLVRVYAVDADNSTSVVGNGTDGLFIWGAQVEAATYPTSYIPTTTTAVTRTQDSASRTAASAFVGLSSGTIYLDLYQEIKSGDLDILSINNASSNYLLRCRLNGNSISFQYNGGLGGTTLAANVNLVNNSRNKIAIKYNAATKVSRTYFNGVFHSTTTGANDYPVLAQNNILIGPWFATSYMQLQGLMLFTNELSDTELETLTTL